MDPERDEDGNDFTGSSIFGAPWFRALLGLIVLALIVVIAMPYFLDWFRPVPSGPAVVHKPQPAPSLRPSPTPLSPPASLTLTPPVRAEKPASQAAATPAAAKPATATKPPPKASAEPAKEDDEAAPPAIRGGYMIQLGAFQDAANAERLAARLAKEKYPLQRETVTRPVAGGGEHEVVIIGASVDEVNGKLQGAAHKAAASPEGVVIRPALSLKEAVALSRELRGSGLNVKIRRAQGTGTLHVVRVGAYPDRSRAEVVRKELEEKGFAGIIVQGAAR